MPNFRKLDPAEVQTIQNKGKGERTLIAEQYDAILSDYAVGEYGEATLDEDEKRLTVKNRLIAAAIRRGVDINFRRTNGNLIRFQVVEHSNGASAVVEPEPEPEPAAPAKKKGGRPKKTVA